MRKFALIAMTLIFLAPLPLQAQEFELAWRAHASEHDRARDEMRAGQILSLETVLRNVRQQYPGELLNAHLRGGVYEIKMLSRGGRVTSIVCDAKTGEILQVREGGPR